MWDPYAGVRQRERETQGLVGKELRFSFIHYNETLDNGKIYVLAPLETLIYLSTSSLLFCLRTRARNKSMFLKGSPYHPVTTPISSPIPTIHVVLSNLPNVLTTLVRPLPLPFSHPLIDTNAPHQVEFIKFACSIEQNLGESSNVSYLLPYTYER